MIWLRIPVRLKKIYTQFNKRSFTILDIGCGNHSPSETKKYFPSSTYHGLDRESYNLDQQDKDAIDHFYSLDLDKDSLDLIPGNFYDVVMMSHVLEHLQDPCKVLAEISSKLKAGGKIYLEFPAIASLGLPSMEGTLQFCDDKSHITLPNPYELVNLLLKNQIRILKARTRRDGIRLLTSPLFILKNLLRLLAGKKRDSRGLWDVTGFAFYIYGEKQ